MIKKITLLLQLLCLITSIATAQISITNSTPYTQDFDGLPYTGAATATNPNPANWYRYAKTASATMLTVGNGSSNTGGFYSAGDTALATRTNRSLGSLLSSTSKPLYFGAQFVNNTGAVIVSATVSYKCKQWRRGNGTAGLKDSLLVEYATSTDSIHLGTWTNVPALMGNSTVVTPTTGNGAINGNTNFQSVSGNITGMAIPIGAKFWIRFNDYDIAGSDDLLAVDDFSVSFTTGTLSPCTEPANSVTNVVVNGTSTTAISGSFTGTTPAADGYLVLIDSNAVVPTITDASIYMLGLVVGSAEVIANGTSTNFSMSGLVPNTNYHVYVFPYNNTGCTGGPNYKTTTVATGAGKTLLDACPEPTVKPTNLVFNNVTTNSIKGKFNKTVPAPTGYIVVYGTSPNLGYPLDTATYTVGDSIKYSSYKSKVAYIGTDSNFTVNGLISGTRYYFAVLPFNTCPYGPNYLRTTPLKGDTLTGGTPPLTDCTQPSGINTSLVIKDSTMTSITVKWKNPSNADSIMVMAGPNLTVGYVTLHDSIYYAVGSTIPSSGAKVYYRGTDSTFTISGLTASTVYKILFATFNNKGCINGPNYSGVGNITVKTASVPPGECDQPSGVSNTTIVKLDSTSSTIKLKWTNPANADSVMVLAGPDLTIGYVTLHDSIAYTVGTTIPSTAATVYYRGTDSSLTITGLTANTLYKVIIVSFNNKACNYGPNYAGLASVKIKTALNSGVKYHNSEAEFALYPNPTNNGSLFLKFKNSIREDAVVEILDIVGRKIDAQKLQAGTDMKIFDINNFAKGTYILNVVYKGTNNVSTFIVE